MAAKTISTSTGTYATHGFTFHSGTNSLSITSTGLVEQTTTSGLAAIYGPGGSGTSWTLSNYGRVIGTASGLDGIYLGNVYSHGNSPVTSAFITNHSGGTIAGANYAIFANGPTTINNQSGGTLSGNNLAGAVEIENAAGTVFNYGLLTNSGGLGLYLQGGGTVINASGGTISASSGGTGVRLNAAGAVTNAGKIIGGSSSYGVLLAVSGSALSNTATGMITGGSEGVVLQAGGTVTNAGTISGGSGKAVSFASSADLLIVDPGATFVGGINGGTGELELAGTASAGTLSGFGGSTITNFATLDFSTGATWTAVGKVLGFGNVTVTNSNTYGFNSIAGFTSTDTIDLTNFTFSGATASFATNALTLTNSAAQHATLRIQGAFSASDFALASYGGGAGTAITLLCFVAGTRIATPTGEVPVERLAVADMVLTQRGEAKPITWIGKGKVLVTGAQDSAARPVIVRRGALADNVPNRDLHVTKGHSLYLDEVLIPVEFLVNHRSIAWDDRRQEVEIYHIELAAHDVLIANGAPAESYRDDGNRWLFHNANSGWEWPEMPPCAPVLTGGPVVDAVWRRLLDRSGPRLDIPTTSEPDLHLLVDGRRVDGRDLGNGAHRFLLPQSSREVRIISRAAAQDQLGLSRDARLLGVALRQIALWQGRHLKVMAAADASLCDGFHPVEVDCDFRWTDGNALLPLTLFDGVHRDFELELHIAHTTHYALCEDTYARAAA